MSLLFYGAGGVSVGSIERATTRACRRCRQALAERKPRLAAYSRSRAKLSLDAKPFLLLIFAEHLRAQYSLDQSWRATREGSLHT